MARYRIGETPEPGSLPAADNMLLVAVVLGLLIGIGFTIAGIRARQYWLAIWGAGLSLVSLAYIAYQFML